MLADHDRWGQLFRDRRRNLGRNTRAVQAASLYQYAALKRKLFAEC